VRILTSTFLFSLQENKYICKSFNVKSAEINVCELGLMVEENEFISSVCDDYEGDIYPLNINVGFPNYYGTYRQFPYCKPALCDDSDITAYFNYLANIFSQDVSVKLDIGPPVSNSCDETHRSKAFIKRKNGSVIGKPCAWVKKRPESVKNMICNKKTGFDGFAPAGEVCPATCCTCTEDSNNVFLNTVRVNKNGMVNIVSRDCAWLKNASQKTRNRLCSKSEASYIGGFSPAYISCPETCEACLSN